MIDRSFEKYKRGFEDYLINISILYSGDVLNSIDRVYTKDLNHSSYSSILMSEVMVDIYNWSFQEMIKRSKEITVNKDDYPNRNLLIQSGLKLKKHLKIDPMFLFYSTNSMKFIKKSDAQLLRDNSYLPAFFKKSGKIKINSKSDIDIYHSPFINDDPDDSHLYIVDGAIQSLVWSIQNMTYDIEKKGNVYQHTVRFPIYECDYNAYKIRFVDVQKLRDEKIELILK